jgi:hypothetical protein
MRTKKQQQTEGILNYGFKLNRIFKTQFGPVELCKKLHRIEKHMHRLAEDDCNGLIDETKLDNARKHAFKKLDEILGFQKIGIRVFVNGDPRGYALKIETEDAKNLDIQKDWGGYGILAPEF